MFMLFEPIGIFQDLNIFLFLQAIPIPSSRAASLHEVFNLAADRMGFKFEILKRMFLLVNYEL